MADDWFAAQGAPGGGTAQVAGFMAPRKSAEDVQLLQDPAFKAQYGQWVQAQGPGAADWATPTIFQQQRQQGAPGGMQYPGGSATFNEQGGGYQAPAPWPGVAVGTGPAAQAGGNPTDRNYVMQAVQQTAQQMQAAGQYVNPSVFKDPGYWADRIIEKGGWVNNGPDQNNIGYFSGRFGMPEGAPAAGGAAPGAAGGVGSFGGMGGPRPYGTSAAPEATPFSYAAFQAPAPFEAPQLNETTDPGYKARLTTGLDAIQHSAAAKGTLLTGGTLKGLNRFAQDYASNEYGNVYNRARGAYDTNFNQGLQAYNTNYNTAYQPWQSNFNNAYQSWQGNLGAQNQGYNQLFSLANMGYGAAGQQGALGTAYAGQAGNLLGSQATNTGNLITGAGNAASAGTIGQANAFNQGLAGASNAAQTYYLSRLLNPGTPSTPAGQTPPYFAY
jgi:hypothetical protein